MIKNIIELTGSLRSLMPPEKRDYLLIGRVRVPARATSVVQGYSEVNGAMHTYFRDGFCREHNLERFTVQQIRATGAVIVNRLFGGDVKTAQLLLNHLSISTADSYVRKDARRLEAGRVADQMEKRLRFARSGGLRDVREQHGAPQSAATPGFVCADPFSPPGSLVQEPGMCAAYGTCPVCPLASVDRRSALSFAYVLRLRTQLIEAHHDPRMSPQRWLAAWKPRLIAIEETWIPLFSDDVRAEAAANVHDVPFSPLPLLWDI